MATIVNKWWTGIGLLLLYIAFNAYSRIQQWGIFLPGWKFEAFTPQATALIAPFLMLPLSVILFYLTKTYFAHGRLSPKLVCAFPKAFNVDLDPALPIAWRYQNLFLFLFFVFPMLAYGHFLREFWEACGEPQSCMEWHGFGVLVTSDFQFHGVTFFPVFQPLAITAVCAGMIALHGFTFYLAHLLNKRAIQEAPDEASSDRPMSEDSNNNPPPAS